MHNLETNKTILIVEDSPEDFEASKRAYAEPAKSPRPGIILLDLNLPGTDGREVLQEVKADKDLCNIPVIILTTSEDERDIETCYKYGANSYLKKPVDLEGFFRAITMLKEFWFEIAILPRGEKNNV